MSKIKSRAQRATIALVKTFHVGLIVNNLDGKMCAVGTIQTLKDRLYEETMRAKNPNWDSTPLRDAIRVSGEQNFSVKTVLSTIDKNAGLLLKKSLIVQHKLNDPQYGYNS